MFAKKLSENHATSGYKNLSSQQQKIASDSGHASTKGKNLRDSLLTQHTITITS